MVHDIHDNDRSAPARPGRRPASRIVGACVGAAAIALAAAGCGGEDGSAAASDGRLQVVTTVAPITSIVAAVGGDLVHIEGLVPEGTNSHTYEPPPAQPPCSPALTSSS